jgi:periodic tryptophan protein 2
MGYPFEVSAVCGTIYSRGVPLFYPPSLASPSGTNTTSLDNAANSNTSLLFSIVGNRICAVDCLKGHTRTLASFSARANLDLLAVSPSRNLLFCADVNGHCSLLYLPSLEFPPSGAPFPCVVLSHLSHAPRVRCASFSPDGSFLAIGHGRSVHIWALPPHESLLYHRSFAPLVKAHVATGFAADVSCMSWSSNSKYVVCGALDTSVRVIPILHSPQIQDALMAEVVDPNVSLDVSDAVGGDATVQKSNKQPQQQSKRQAKKQQQQHQQHQSKQQSKHVNVETKVLMGHKSMIVGVWFDSASSETVYSVSKDGALVIWSYSQGSYSVAHRHYLSRPPSSASAAPTISSADFCAPTRILALGFTDGVFGIYDLSLMTSTITLALLSASADPSIPAGPVMLALSKPKGEWVSLALPHASALLVYEYASESFVFRQRAPHLHAATCASYSLDGSLVAVGDDHGDVRVYNPATGFATAAFHAPDKLLGIGGAAVTALAWSPSQALFASTSDGNVRAFDPLRGREFKRYSTVSAGATANASADDNAQKQCMSMDVDSAGELLVVGSGFEAHVFEVRTATRLMTLSGHDSLISSVRFSPKGDRVATCSWDGTVRVHSLTSGSAEVETWTCARPVLSCSYRHDGRFLAVALQGGVVQIWDTTTGLPVLTIETKREFGAADKEVEHVAYSADGGCVLVGGRSNYMLVYAITTPTGVDGDDTYGYVLLRKYALSRNSSYTGVKDRKNSKFDIEGIDADEMEETVRDAMEGKRLNGNGVAEKKAVMRVRGIGVSPTGDAFSVTCTEGVLLFTQDVQGAFVPLSLGVNLTPQNVFDWLESGRYVRALLGALRLNVRDVLWAVLGGVPLPEIRLVVTQVPVRYVPSLVSWIAKRMGENSVELDAKNGSSDHGKEESAGVPIERVLVWAVAVLEGHGRILESMMARDREGFLAHVQPRLRELLRSVARVRGDLARVCDSTRYLLRFVLEKRKRMHASSDA